MLTTKDYLLSTNYSANWQIGQLVNQNNQQIIVKIGDKDA